MPSVEECRQTMSNWAGRVQRRAATLSHVVASCSHLFSPPYPRRMEKVKFGIPLEDVCRNNNIPGLLLVLVLKLNKEGLYKKDIFRAPGHQGNIRKLVNFLQVGRIVNLDRFSPYTIASVLKKFLSKIPGGIFGRAGERELFRIIELDDEDVQRALIRRLILSLPDCTQKLLVLLFGTLRLIATNADEYKTGMTSEALGVSVAPSFFHTCVSDGREATMDDVLRFKVATKIMKFMIDNFGKAYMFGRENYEFYARMTGRVLKVDNDWIFSVGHPPNRGLTVSEGNLAVYDQADARSCLTPANLVGARPAVSSGSLADIHQSATIESSARISMSLEEIALSTTFAKCTPKAVAAAAAAAAAERMAMEEPRIISRNAQSTKSLSFLPEVEERQVERMRARSEWFLSPVAAPRQVTFAEDFLAPQGSGIKKEAAGLGAAGLSASAETVQKDPIKKQEDAGEKEKLEKEDKEEKMEKEDKEEKEEKKEKEEKEEKEEKAVAKKAKSAAKPKKVKKVLAMAQ